MYSRTVHQSADVTATVLVHVRYYLRRHPLPAILHILHLQLFATINNETSWEVLLDLLTERLSSMQRST